MHGVNHGAHVRQLSCCGCESDMPATVISGHLRVCIRKARIKVCRLNWHWRVDDSVEKVGVMGSLAPVSRIRNLSIS